MRVSDSIPQAGHSKSSITCQFRPFQLSRHTGEDEGNAEVANSTLVQMVTPVPTVTTWQGSLHHAVGRAYLHTATVT